MLQCTLLSDCVSITDSDDFATPTLRSAKSSVAALVSTVSMTLLSSNGTGLNASECSF